MKKKSLTIYLSFLFLFLTVTSVQAKNINIVTTTTDIASITREIGGDFVSVDSIAKGGQDPHYIQAKPSYMVKLNRADLLIYQGLQLEIEWLSLLIEGARNSIRHMIDLLVQKHNIPDSKAYMFCSVCADLRISEVVDAPNWVVSCYFPKSVFN